MPRAVTTSLTVFAVLALTALPGFAAESKGPAVTGSTTGVLLGLLVGVLFGTAVTLYTYSASRYGESKAQYEYAHDIREGLGGHEPHEHDVGTAVVPDEEMSASA